MTELELMRQLRSHTLKHWDVVHEWAYEDIASDGGACLLRYNYFRGNGEWKTLTHSVAIAHQIFMGTREGLLRELDRAIARLEEQEVPCQPLQEDPAPLTRQFYALHRAKTGSAAPERQLCGVGSEV